MLKYITSPRLLYSISLKHNGELQITTNPSLGRKKKQQVTTWLLPADYVCEITNVEIYVDHIKCLSPTPEGKSRSHNCVDEEEERFLNC